MKTTWIIVSAALMTLASFSCSNTGGSPEGDVGASDGGSPATQPEDQASHIENADVRTLDVMQQKQALVNSILSALAIEDYHSITQNAEGLTQLSLESDWFIHETESYIVLSEQFRNAARTLADDAQREDYDRTAASYKAMIGECLKCHEYLRREGLMRSFPGRVTWLAH